MEEQLRKELVNLCHEIIEKKEEQTFDDQLSSVRALYEKLLVLNYLSQRNPSQPSSAPVSNPVAEEVAAMAPEEPAVEEETTIKQEEPPAEKAEPKISTVEFVKAEDQDSEVIHGNVNESPVELRELADDRTPEQLKATFQPPPAGSESRPSSINERYGTGSIKLGLNDRLAFTNHLFDGSQEDLNRVLSQINTFESYNEAENFITQMVKPDYDWSQKEEFEMRFMDRVKQRFGEQ